MQKSFLYSLTVSLAGLLFGFDTIVISGVDQILQTMWDTSDVFHGFVVMSAALWGTVLGAMFGGWPTDRWGRKQTLIAIGALYLLSALGSALVSDPLSFALFRFVGGLGVGASTIAAPAYISEIAPAHSRGRLVALYQLSIVVGILVAFWSNYLLRNIGENSWRWMLGVEAIPAVLYTILVFNVPRSPRWLIMKNRINEATNILRRIRPGSDIKGWMAEIRDTGKLPQETIFSPRYRPALMLVFFIAFFNQFSGINAFLYYSPRIFESAGLGATSALLSSVGIGVTNVIFTLVGMALVDRLGRKQLMYIGSAGYIISLSGGALSFFAGWSGLAVPIFLFMFIASHAIGQGTVIWVFIAEIFPNQLRAQGQAFGSSVHWVLAALIPSFIPFLFKEVGAGPVFAFFAVMMVGQLIWVATKMPETKGRKLEELSAELQR